VLIQNARAIWSNPGCTDLRIEDNKVLEIGHNLPTQNNEHRVDASGCVIWPGLINTHHHLVQSALKAVPEGLNHDLNHWLSSVPYRFWPKFNPELVYYCAKLGLYELQLSGATTCADHFYWYHADSSQEMEDALWQAAADMGMRFVLCRGGATQRSHHRGMNTTAFKVETIEQMLARLEFSLDHYHQRPEDALQKLVVAPTTLAYSAAPDHLRELASFARDKQLKLHSHLLETSADNEFCLERYALSAVDFAESVNWLGKDVWFAHLVKTNTAAIQKLASSGTAIAHCPTSNCRLGSGIAPALAMNNAGMPITLGVDGSASSESGSMIQELNLSWLLQRAQNGADALEMDEVLHWATLSGAAVLGFPNLGALAAGQCADLVAYDLNEPRFAGVHSIDYAPLICAEPIAVKHCFINGRHIIDNGEHTSCDRQSLLAELRQCMKKLL